MLRRSFRVGLLFGLFGGALAAVAKAFQSRSTSAPAAVAPRTPAPPWTPLPDAEPVVVPPRPKVEVASLQESPVEPPAPAPAPAAAPPKPAPAPPKPAKKPAAAKKAPPAKAAPWVAPVDGEAPVSHPIKAKMSSGIYHVPGGFNYARTRPDRCYRDVEAAEADGLRPSKR